MVGANSVVTGVVPSGVLVSGVPAVEVRRVQLPWET
jgi:acetyltransferase-like isoleucine patch superfamily enzyme